MPFKAILFTSILFTSAFGFPTIRSTPVSPGAPVSWTLSNFSVGCSPGGCEYRFNISSHNSQGPLPAFSTSCSGIEAGNDTYHACSDAQIQSLMRPTQEGITDYWQVFVQRLYPESRTPQRTALVAGNVSFPEQGGQNQHAEMLAYSYGTIVGDGCFPA
ncbi:hypothetical protein D0Z07_4164 [Hyphodiscus hymeniophilus]|uniref:Uncharacterized protein n=1 Tax=Hyphodiscus hymeniophilus TaxID=353542 RepID=A0A9P6VJH0_9HELO|nr:hypothetical protein D0Z07_4164 [Hyphodiscus hymeniophilus]